MFLLMTDGAWHCQGTVGQACASSVPPAPLLCSPSTQTPNMHTLPCFLTWPISLEHWRTAPPPPIPPYSTPNLPMCLSVSRSITLPLSVSHTGMLLFLRCPLRGCLRTDIYGPWQDGREEVRLCWYRSYEETEQESVVT